MDNISESQRKKPTQTRSSKLVLSIFEAATRILPKSGYDSVTTNQLAKVAGVSIGSLYQYFANKDEIFALLMEKNLIETRALVEEVVKKKSDVSLKKLIEEAVATVVDLNLDNREFFARLFMQAPRLNRVKKVMESRDQFIDLLVEVMNAKRLEVREGDLKLMAYNVVHSVMGVVQTVLIHQPESLQREALKSELTFLAQSYLCRENRISTTDK